MLVRNNNFIMQEEMLLPKVIKNSNTENFEELESCKEMSLSFDVRHTATLNGKGAYVLLDFGKEICGGIRFLTRSAPAQGGELLIRFGESVSEALAPLGFKNAGNDHSPREITVNLSFLSDLTFGQTGFRFAYIELLSEESVSFRNIFAVSKLPFFENEEIIQTGDTELDKVLETAAYTLKLCCQNGYIWDGIKRDRLVWCGDLHQEILTAFYLFGDIPNITASLEFLRDETPASEWMNHIPAYSIWWVICLCDYCTLSGNKNYFEKNKDYAVQIIKKVNDLITQNGEMQFSNPIGRMTYFLDWPTCGTPDAEIGTAALCVYMAKKFTQMLENNDCEEIKLKLNHYLNKPCNYKQVKAFQILAGGDIEGAAEFLEKNGAEGFSTFMAYYILTADRIAGGNNMIPIIKEYFGAMLRKGATTFWEDFDISWVNESGRIDELPSDSQKDIHGDYGRFCYEGFRHSFCHGWASGVYAYVKENEIV